MKKTMFRTALALAMLLGSAVAPAIAQDARDIYEVDGFGYHLPDAVSEFPGLGEQLTAEREQARAEFDDMAAAERAAMPDSPMTAHLASQTRWNIAARAGRLLSLTSETYLYSGGAHGMTGYSARLWDMIEDRAVALTDLFTDRYAALAIIDREYCRQLAAMQAERGVPTGDSWWNACPLLHEQAIAPGGEEGGRFVVIQVAIGPYVAGPYAAGSFEVIVPVTPALIALVKPEYRGAFAVGE